MNYLKTLASGDHLVTDKHWAVSRSPCDHKPGYKPGHEEGGLTWLAITVTVARF